jgi:hypothetical protein
MRVRSFSRSNWKYINAGISEKRMTVSSHSARSTMTGECSGDTRRSCQERHDEQAAATRTPVADGIFDIALRVFHVADEEGVSPAVAADRLAEERMASIGRLATIRL